MKQLRFCTMILLCLSALMLSGCVERTVDGDKFTFAISGSVVGITFLAAVLALVVGGYVFKKTARRAFGVLIILLGIVCLVLVGPGMMTGKTVVDPDHFEVHYGFWFSPKTDYLRFKDLQAIRWVGQRTRRGIVTYTMYCQGRDGLQIEVPGGDTTKEALLDIRTFAIAAGVNFTVSEPN